MLKMPPAGEVAKFDCVQVAPTATVVQPAPPLMSQAFAKDAIMAWFRGEFAAANAIIDALCNHLTQLEGGVSGEISEYESVFAAIHRRRLNWIPVLQMQKYCSIADVALELRNVAAKKAKTNVKMSEEMNGSTSEKEKIPEASEEESNENGNGEVVDEDSARDDSTRSEITDTGSQEEQPLLNNTEICSSHEDCEERLKQIKMTKGYIAKEPVKGHMVNVLRGLKLYENIFTDTELSKLHDFVNELRVAGQNDELSDDLHLYNQQLKGNKRQLIQLGVPIFGHMQKEEMTKCQKSHIMPIPALLQGVIEHLIQWHLISENRKPNGCIINFFDEGEYSQPFTKPPHLEQPISTLLLSESRMAFGRTLVTDNEGNCKGPLMLSLKEGSLLVMRGNSADIARHVMCASPNKRASITFFKVRMQNENGLSTMPPLARAMTLWQPGVPTPYTIPNGTLNGYKTMDVIPKWGLLQPTMVMLAPLPPVVLTPRRIPHGGTGVFLPWTVGSRKPAKHLPPRAQRGRFLTLPAPVDTDHNVKPDEKRL